MIAVSPVVFGWTRIQHNTTYDSKHVWVNQELIKGEGLF